ncbi:DUF1295 domain-containing protein [Candidatus Bathyarchaeota archaeon]|nr:DUF1295 domain-containing protein [Candidatus Bathyarchaeota archaeon]
MKMRVYAFLRRVVAGAIALINLIPSIVVIFNPLFFVMFLPIGAYAILTQLWILLKDVQDPFHPGESLYWLTYAIKTDEDNILLPTLFRWGIIDLSLLAVGSVIFLLAFAAWITNLGKGGGLLTSGIYGLVRHPQYLGLILLTLGITIRSLRPISFIAWIILLFGYLILASLEERDLIKKYDQRYIEYSRRTAFMIPFLRLNLPELFSPRKPYRYIVFMVLCVLLIVAVMFSMRNMVFALRGF